MSALGLKLKQGLVAKQVDVSRGGRNHTQTYWVKQDTQPVPRVKGPDGKLKPGGAVGSQLPPETLAKLKALGVSKLPAAHIADVEVHSRVDDPEKAKKGILIRWRDDSGRSQRGYSADHLAASHEAIFARTEAQRPKMAALKAELQQRASESPAHAAALLLAETGLRRGDEENIPGHYGGLTMEARHVSFGGPDGRTAKIEYVGKEGKTNVSEISNPAVVSALRAAVADKKPTDKVWPESVNEKSVAKALLPGQKVKDLRTVAASEHAERMLAGIKPEFSGDSKKDARQVLGVIKAVSESVSRKLNNTPAMAKKSYIAPQVWRAWAEKNGVKKEWIK